MQFMGWKAGRFMGKPGLIIAFVLLLIPKAASAAQPHPRWSLNFTPVIIPSGKGYRSGGGLDPEAKWGIGIEGTYQEIHGSDFEFYSYGSMVSFEL